MKIYTLLNIYIYKRNNKIIMPLNLYIEKIKKIDNDKLHKTKIYNDSVDDFLEIIN